MLRDVYWRQYPIDLLNDEKMGYIESLMPTGYEYAPYMYYITALKLADDDGIYDLGDGIIFARLMRVQNPELVFFVTNLMRQYKIIYRLSDVMREEFLYYLWENRLIDKALQTTEGESIEVVATGYRNTDSGPDFLEARIQIGDKLWAGHVKST